MPSSHWKLKIYQVRYNTDTVCVCVCGDGGRGGSEGGGSVPFLEGYFYKTYFI